MNIYILLGTVIVLGLIVISLIIFIWWQFSFTDSKLCRLIDSRSGNLSDFIDEEDEEEEDID